jgi:archaellum component FlaF (FlaF/FlaG flagellin family)
MCQSSLPNATHVEIIFQKYLAKSKLIDKIFYSLGQTTVPTSIVNIIVVGTYLNVGGGLQLDHRIKLTYLLII